MTERELALYEIVARSIPVFWREVHLATSERARYEELIAYLEAECADLKAESAVRFKAAMEAKGWRKHGDSWSRAA